MKQLFAAALMVSVPVYGLLIGDKPQPSLANVEVQTSLDIMSELQQKLYVEPNNAELWFQLGDGYLYEQDFAAAVTCFDYAIRLSDVPQANQLAGKAAAMYYGNKQRMTPEIDGLLQQALELEPNNTAALTLIASDHFVSFRYQKAIDTWVQLLDSNQMDVDRRKVVTLLNQAKDLLQASRS